MRKKLADKLDIDNISIDEMRTYINKNDEKHSVWIWTACIEKIMYTNTGLIESNIR